MRDVRRQINLNHSLAIIIGTVIGSGVFIQLPIVQQATGSPGLAIIAWLIGGIIWLPQLFILAEMGTAYPQQGFGYLYLQKAGSPGLAFIYVWTVFWTSDTPSITILAVAAVAALDVFFPVLADSYQTKIIAALIIMALTWVHVRSVNRGGQLQVLLTIVKLSPLVLLSVLGFFFFDSPHLFMSSTLAADKSLFVLVTAGVAATVWSYAGFPNILYMAGEIKEPGKTLPMALLGSLLVVTAVYVLVAAATGALVPHDVLVGSAGGFANPFKYLPWFAGIAAGFLAIAAFTSMVGATNACIMVQPRIEYAIAQDNLFFPIFGKLHTKYGTPANSILIQSGLAIIMIFIGGIEALMGYFTLSYILQNLVVYVVIFWLRKRDDYRPAYKSPAWQLMALLAIIFQVLLLFGTFNAFPLDGVLAALILILTGLPVYFYFKKRQNLSTGH
ncbi:MAG: amino acid permease [Candidatus Marinimicrobia bacterium]|nr:amino acid permease [Candidatus Neomarinimicrobiota bacterium]MCF7904615.1 amino acid permease [Candidatus Neomarinimicrobiota bacterium]